MIINITENISNIKKTWTFNFEIIDEDIYLNLYKYKHITNLGDGNSDEYNWELGCGIKPVDVPINVTKKLLKIINDKIETLFID